MRINGVLSRFFNLGMIAVAAVLWGTAPSRMAWAEVFSGYPDIIVCQAPNFRIAFYIDRKDNDGVVWYKTMERQVAKIDKQSIFRREHGSDCNGKTLEELRKEGKTLNTTD